jgi:glutaminase
MTSSGMYDYAGEWIYRVGIPAKSGVGGGILAALPARLGLGSYSPKLDSHGNSVRGIKVCEALSSHYDLHMLNRSDDAATASSPTTTSSAFRRAAAASRTSSGEPPNAPLLILDFRRVPDLTAAGAQLLSENLTILGNAGVTTILTGLEATSAVWTAVRARTAEPQRCGALRCSTTPSNGPRTRSSIAMAASPREGNQPSRRAGAAGGSGRRRNRGAGGALDPRRYEAGQRIISAGEPANSLFFLQSGMVSVKLPSGVRLASLGPGMEFGEMAIIENKRSADVWADTPVKCLELPLDSFCRLPPAPSADRDEDHAQSVRAAGAAPDPRQRQGRSAQRVLDELTAKVHSGQHPFDADQYFIV